MGECAKIKLNIGGMSCVHCQNKIEERLLKEQGVLHANVSYGKGTAEIEYDESVISAERITEIIENLDYQVLTDDGQQDGESNGVTNLQLFYPFIIFAIIVAVFVPLQYFGLLNYLAPSDLADSNMGYGMLFVIGLITSVHCVAMCGGINLSQCIPKRDEKPEKGFKAFIPAIFYNLGRVISYTLIGLILGCVGWGIGGGAEVGINNIVQGVFKLIAGIFMIIMGVNMLGIIPALRRLNPTVPKFLAKRLGKAKARAASPFIVGLLNGLMPCGPLQAMWIVALATGTPWGGALSMFLFALGTVPLMLGLGSIVAKLGQKFSKAVMTVGSLLVVILGLAMLSQGGSLTGFSFFSPVVLITVVLSLIFIGIVFSTPLAQNSVKVLMRATACLLVIVVGLFTFWVNSQSVKDGTYDVSVVNGDKQTVTSTLAAGRYPNISVQKDIPVVWIIDAPDGSVNGCNYKVLIPEYNVEYVFQKGENVIEFTPTKSGSFSFSCWMGMIYGKIKVTD